MKLEVLHRSSLGRFLGLTFLYAVVLTAAMVFAYQVRFDFDIPAPDRQVARYVAVYVVSIQLASLFVFRQFEGLLSYFSIPDLRRIFFAMSTSSLALLLAWIQVHGYGTPPRGVILVDYVVSILGLSILRLGFRLIRERYLAPQARTVRRRRRVGIIGAGDVGAALVRELTSKRGLGLQPVVFFDDDPSKWRSRVHEIPVVGPPESLMDNKLNLQLEEVIIAMPSAPARRIGEIVQILQKAHLKFETVPSMDQLATGKVRVSQLREVEIQDLLGRPPVELEAENIRNVLTGKVVMVTGAGGSIGSELCRQIAAFNPQRLLLVEQSEVQIFVIEQELIGLGYSGIILPLVADILDGVRMRGILKRFSPHVIFHAAAHKHVPMMESQPGEAIKNNSFGTARLCDLALEFGVERFVLISTDKAINPTNVMGASKRLAEIYLQALYATAPKATRFMAVRFGNVLGSSGSVIPIFKKQIAAGGPVRVTHPDVTRYFMTIPEAVGLVLQSGAMGDGGEIFILDMGQPVKIVDLAKQLIELSGLRPDEDIEIQYVGLRPGEKLYEELAHSGENISGTGHPKIFRLNAKPEGLSYVQGALQALADDAPNLEPTQIKLRLQQVVPEYKPYLT